MSEILFWGSSSQIEALCRLPSLIYDRWIYTRLKELEISADLADLWEVTSARPRTALPKPIPRIRRNPIHQFFAVPMTEYGRHLIDTEIWLTTRALEKLAGVAFMSEEYKVTSKSGGTTTEVTSTADQPIEAFVVPIVTAQLAVFELMIQCAFAWANEPISQVAAKSQQGDANQKQEFLGSSYSEAATAFGADWLASPMITGIDETLNDEFFKRRPRNIQERDILTLKEPSSDFEANDVPSNTQIPDIHSEAA